MSKTLLKSAFHKDVVTNNDLNLNTKNASGVSEE